MTTRVWVVDDDERFRERLAQALAARDFEVEAAGDPEVVLAWLRGGRAPDAAVIDLRMPGGSGLDVVRTLRERAPACRAVVLTGYGAVATAVEAIKLGAVDYLQKPIATAVLVAALRGEPPPLEHPEPEDPEAPSLARTEWEHIQRVLADCDGNISEAARRLRLHRRTLQRKLARYAPR